MSETTELTRRTEATGELTIPELASSMQKLREVMKSVMVENSDYGVVPGTKSKPTLLKPGGEKLAMMCRLAPEFHEEVTQLANGHREYQVKCRLIHIPTGNFAGEASAVCSTLESKYRYRGGARVCPQCGKPCIKKSKFPPRNKPGAQPGFYCFAKVGGCGAEFDADDAEIVNQSEAKTENPDIADCYNTVKQIAQKRAFISAIKTATASSELFTQDVEDGIVPGHEVEHHDHDERMAAARTAMKSGSEQAERATKPREETPQWMTLKEALIKVGCTPGKAEEARAVIKYVMPGITLEQARATPEDASTVMDALDAALLGHDPQAFLEEAFIAAGLKEAAPA